MGSSALAAYVHHITQPAHGSALLPLTSHSFIPEPNKILFCLLPVEKYDVEMVRLRNNS